MKHLRVIFPLAILMVMQACSNTNSTGSVEKADSLNSAKDTTAMMSSNADSLSNGVNGNVAKFLVNAVNGNLLEVRLGEYAAKNASNPKVKQFAQMAVDVHKSFDMKIKSFAKSRNISLPDSTSEKNMDALQDMMKKTGTDFDKAYMNKVIADHKKDIDMYQKASDDLNDPSVKSFATSTISEIQKHLNEAESIVKANSY